MEIAFEMQLEQIYTFGSVWEPSQSGHTLAHFHLFAVNRVNTPSLLMRKLGVVDK